MSEVKRYHVTETGLVEGESLGRLSVVLAADLDRVTAERDAALAELGRYQSLFNQAQKAIDRLNELHRKRMAEIGRSLTAADERADVLENALRELLSGTGTSPGANKKYGKARAVLEGLRKKADSRICSPANPHNYHLGECTKCGAISPTE